MSLKFSDVKVHNEIELCEIENLQDKDKIERKLLHAQISFYIRWQTKGFFSGLFGREREIPILCVNDAQKEDAIACIGELEKSQGIHVTFLNQKVEKVFF